MSGFIRLPYRSSWDGDELANLAADMRFPNLAFDASVGTVEPGGWRRDFLLNRSLSRRKTAGKNFDLSTGQ